MTNGGNESEKYLWIDNSDRITRFNVLDNLLRHLYSNTFLRFSCTRTEMRGANDVGMLNQCSVGRWLL